MIILFPSKIGQLVATLRDGQVVVLPSETSYGLSCDATNQQAVDHIYDIKQRGREKSLLVVVPNIAMAKKYLEWNKTLDQLASQYWPGPFTIVCRALRSDLASGVVSKQGTLALRVTSHPILKEVSLLLGSPLVSTSANISGQPDLYDPGEILEVYQNQTNQPDYLLDYGVLAKNRPSTLVGVVGGKIEVLRQGEVRLAACFLA